MNIEQAMTVTIAGITFKNPVIAASGTYGFGEDYAAFYPPSRLGGISAKGLTLLPKQGNLSPRVSETKSGMLNSVGLQNPGVDMFISYYLPKLKEICGDTVIIANLAGAELSDYVAAAEKLNGSAIDMLELNISCPNVKKGGATWGISPDSAAEVTRAVRKVLTKKPLIVKLTPNVTDITVIAKAVEDAGADAVSLINTLLGMRIDIKSRRPILRNNVGGLSGAAVFPVALRMVWQTANAVKIPVIGTGGITTREDAVEMFLAGAGAVQVGTAMFGDPYAPVKIIDGIKQYLADNNTSIAEIKGKVDIY